ncbi:MAG: ribose-phosphate pyrophosphokinase [Candidatus Cloacimonetes bacterium]|jgi:ribose-phosphate pyrophosphokinase|nr:ribose-phosphate pyrophosphokinase [Candidatus Cloacimonadota bacterium]MCB5286728.1 ribose-phosphate pyrophosphokinase [Candidatus Cloacimonadota bacterium]MCK9185187.1 ribose-phosphate pyrophosphokinase [Candidatus Cloacimonadota bacterium]MCK9584458.1 ribose-phosphate pyrophosphokinase [Candidatus Cloacimonadota bacterium]MDY0229049.1 ribose-phosphate pyrophosphokinase [Candidatus Cloacimonadaceae bacterium]
MFSKLKLITGNANRPLAEEVARHAGIPLGDIELFKFSNDESFVKINDNVRGADVYLIQPTSYPVNDSLMDLLIIIDALKRASAQRINCVIPYYAYARSDKKDQPRVPITAKLVADLITVAGADRVVTVDLHADQIQGFFNIPVDHLYAIPSFARYFKSIMQMEDIVVVSPDSGGANRARALAKRLNCSMAIGDKRRSGNDDNSELLNVIGDVAGKTAILFDDIIDTGGSLIKMARALQEQGAKKIFAACTHGVLSGKAVECLEASPIEKLFITNTIQLDAHKASCKKIVQLSIAEMLAIAIKKIHIGESISLLFR